MIKHIVYGNGESRQLLDHSEWITTWGCNAIYRDFSVDNLVSVDYNMQQEIYESGYVMKHKCWFSDWEVLPAEFDPHTLLIDNDGPVYETAKLNRKSCVVQGKDADMVQKKIEEERTRKCSWYIDNSVESTLIRYNNYIFNWGNNSITVIDHWGGVCDSINNYVLDQIYPIEGIEKGEFQYSIEWTGNKGVLVLYITYGQESYERKEVFNRIIRNRTN